MDKPAEDITDYNIGWLYCMSNESIPGIYKIGKTDRSPEIRLKEANTCTYALPFFKIEFAKEVQDINKKEKAIHLFFASSGKRVHPKREFFKTSVEEIKALFDLTDGKDWTPESIIEPRPDNILDNTAKQRDMTKLFTDKQRIRHVIQNKEWIGEYVISKNEIMHNDVYYKSLSGFAKAHYSSEGKIRSVNGWEECEYEVNDVWVKTK